jgi:hypothetical protein
LFERGQDTPIRSIRYSGQLDTVIGGFTPASRLVTAAAIMISVFAGFIVNSDPP